MSSCTMQSHLENSGYEILPISPDNAGSYDSSIPLILPNDHEYNLKTKRVLKKADVQRSSLYLVPEALELLNSVQSPLAVMAICGPMRTGKSYILSRLLGEPDAFELGHSFNAKTMGIWMATKILEGKDKNGNKQAVLLLDTEGIDAPGASLSFDAAIFVLTVLISSVLIYNSQNVPYKSDLEKLDCFIRLAQGFEVKKDKKLQGGEVSKYFPHFIWLLRDVNLSIKDDDDNEMVPTDYIMKKVLSRGTNFVPDKSDEVGRAIVMFFPDIECKILPTPHCDKKIMQNIANHTNNLNPEFQSEVQDFMTHLITKLQTNGPKHGYEVGSEVTGPLLCGLLKEYVEAVNDPGAIPCLDNAWQNTVDLLKTKTMDELVEKYKAAMTEEIQAASVRGDGKTYPLEEHKETTEEIQAASVHGDGKTYLLEEHKETTEEIQAASVHGDGKTHPLEEHEETKSGDVTLIGIHDKILPTLTDELLKKVAHFGIGNVKDSEKCIVDTFQKKIVVRKKKAECTVYEDGNTVYYEGMEVCGGELLEFIRKNRKLSEDYCTKLYQELFAPIQFKIENEVKTYTSKKLEADFKKINEDYKRQAIGPEKWNVLSEIGDKTMEAQKSTFKKIKGYQEKAMKQKLKANAAEAEARKKDEELKKLYQESLRQKEEHADNLKKLKETFANQIKKLEDEAEQTKDKVKKIEDLHKSKFDEYEGMIEEANVNHAQIVNDVIVTAKSEVQEREDQIKEMRKDIDNTRPPCQRQSTYAVKGEDNGCCSIL